MDCWLFRDGLNTDREEMIPSPSQNDPPFTEAAQKVPKPAPPILMFRNPNLFSQSL
jgi:hypothetical protein